MSFTKIKSLESKTKTKRDEQDDETMRSLVSGTNAYLRINYVSSLVGFHSCGFYGNFFPAFITGEFDDELLL
jgi:hypothetical protein